MARLSAGLVSLKGPARIGTSTANGSANTTSTLDMTNKTSREAVKSSQSIKPAASTTLNKAASTTKSTAVLNTMPKAANQSMSKIAAPAADELGSLPSFAPLSGKKGLVGATSLQDMRSNDPTSAAGPSKSVSGSLQQSAGHGAKSTSAVHMGTRGLTPSTSEDVTTLGVFRPFLHRLELTDIHVVKFSPESDYIAIGLGNGNVHVYSIKGNLVSKCVPPTDPSNLVCAATTINFRPASGTNKNTILVGYPTGFIHTFHFLSGTFASSVSEGENQILAMDCDATRLVTAGEDAAIRVYHDDNGTWKVHIVLKIGSSDRETGHSNRIFAVKFFPNDANRLISGGWDNTLRVWNLTTGLCESSIYGPHIAGEGLDINEAMQCVTASYRKEEPLQLWQLAPTADGEQKPPHTIPWTLMKDRPYTMLYSAQFCQLKFGPCAIAAGGGGVNEVKCFDLSTERCIGAVINLKDTVYSVSVSKNGRFVAFGGRDQTLHVVEVAKDMTGDFSY